MQKFYTKRSALSIQHSASHDPSTPHEHGKGSGFFTAEDAEPAEPQPKHFLPRINAEERGSIPVTTDLHWHHWSDL